ncbi:hypothetical protein ACOAPY_00910 [Pseudomonas sp. P3C3]
MKSLAVINGAAQTSKLARNSMPARAKAISQSRDDWESGIRVTFQGGIIVLEALFPAAGLIAAGPS